MKRTVSLFLFLVIMVGSSAISAEEPPFQLPLDRAVAIPDSQGMGYFYGEWEPQGTGGGGTLTIRPGEYKNETSEHAQAYRVLHEEKNYVLIITLKRYDTTWVEFEVITLQPVFQSRPVTLNASLNLWSCNDLTIRDNTAAFLWPRERLMNEFARGCVKGVAPEKGYFLFNGTILENQEYFGWDRSIYSRPRKQY